MTGSFLMMEAPGVSSQTSPSSCWTSNSFPCQTRAYHLSAVSLPSCHNLVCVSLHYQPAIRKRFRADKNCVYLWSPIGRAAYQPSPGQVRPLEIAKATLDQPRSQSNTFCGLNVSKKRSEAKVYPSRHSIEAITIHARRGDDRAFNAGTNGI